jgi:3-deoxy-D-manno-octulosonic-acid transferase
MRFCYNLVFTFFFLISAPYYLWKMRRRGNWRAGFAERFGRYDARLKTAITNRHVLWMHAVSVGEVNIATQLIRAIENRFPNLKIVISTTTSTGMGELKKKLPSHIHKIYYPIDRKKYVSRALRVLNPEAIVLVEAEIWPNFLWSARSRKIPVFLVNARLSPKSFRGYKRFGFLFRPIFESLAGVGVQNEEDQRRLIQLGCKAEAVRVVGNLKFEGQSLGERPSVNIDALLKQLGVLPEDPVIIGGSTHSGEEAILARVFKKLRGEFPRLFLIIVPRHFERGKEAAADIQEQGVAVTCRTDISPEVKFERGAVSCLLVNTTGELRFFYHCATAIFIGKSLAGEGGQNPIEPGALGKPIIFGPNMQNFQSISEAFVRNKGALQVQNEGELESAFRDLLRDEKKRAELGRNALRVVQENKGSIDRTVDMIVDHLQQEDIYIAPSPAERL